MNWEALGQTENDEQYSQGAAVGTVLQLDYVHLCPEARPTLS